MPGNPDILTGLTDFALCVETLLLGFFCLTKISRAKISIASLFFFLSAASLFGGIFHILFPLKTATTGGWVIWILVAASTGLVALATWNIIFRSWWGERGSRAVLYAGPPLFLAFIYWITTIDYHYLVIIYFYAPALAAFGITALYKALAKKRGWPWICIGVLLSVCAALIQTANISFLNLDHNSLYHVIQAAALLVLYRGFTRVTIS